MAATPYARGMDELHTQTLRDGRRRRVLALSGTLNYYTAGRLVEAYHALREEQGRALLRLVLDLRRIHQCDSAGAAALLEVVRDADTRAFEFLIGDRPGRPFYRVTGLRDRLKFLSEVEMEELPAGPK